MLIRYANDSDLENFNSHILSDNDANIKLGLMGFEKGLFDKGNYKSAFVLEDSVRIGDNYEDIVIAFGVVSFSTYSGFSYVDCLYVLPEHRKNSYGEKMLLWLIEYAKKNWNTIGIDVLTINNEPMEKFLLKHGFVFSGVYKKDAYLNGTFYDQSRYMKLWEKE